jgi:hypothetical protein
MIACSYYLRPLITSMSVPWQIVGGAVHDLFRGNGRQAGSLCPPGDD